MNDLGPFVQTEFSKRTGDWVGLSEVEEVFDQVIEALEPGLSPELA